LGVSRKGTKEKTEKNNANLDNGKTKTLDKKKIKTQKKKALANPGQRRNESCGQQPCPLWGER